MGESPHESPLLTEAKASNPLYAVFSGPITEDTAKKMANNLIAAGHKGFTEIHILFQTNGGDVSSGIFLHDFLKSYPHPVTIYSAGSVQSIGVTIYLGARRRLAGKNSLFMLHRTTFGPPPITGEKLSNLSGMAKLEDDRTRNILKEHITLTPASWDNLGDNQFWFNPEDAVASGLAHAIGEFSPPRGFGLWSLTL
jgi:ATP-dependent protease ClpP protease subunit